MFRRGGALVGVPCQRQNAAWYLKIISSIGLEDPDYISLTEDPLFDAPGTGGTEIDMTDPDRLNGYRLCKGSPAIGTGREGDNEAQADFWGSEITSMNIGAYGGSGADCGSQ